MSVFATPEPINVNIDLAAGDIRLVAGDRADTVVEVRPSDPADDSDVQAAQETRVEFADGTLTVRGPKSRALPFSKKSRSVVVLVELPTGSSVHTDVALGDLNSTGALGECRLKASAGHFTLDRTGPIRVASGAGHITVDGISGAADVATGTGRVRIGDIGGAAVVKNSNGPTELGAVAGGVRVRNANGDIAVARAGAAVDARTSNGGIRVAEVVRDVVTLHTAAGDVEIGVATGTAAWLDLKTGHGRVNRQLDDLGQAPGQSEETVEVRVHTSYGDITVRRS